jgi:hypothetical protein
MSYPGFTPVVGHTAGCVTPNVSWFKNLSSGLVVEFWFSPESNNFTATLIDPDSNYKPGQLYVSENSLLDYFHFSNFAQLLNHFWFNI